MTTSFSITRGFRAYALAWASLAGLALLLVGQAQAQSGSKLVENSWQVECNNGTNNCIAYYVRPGLQIFIGKNKESNKVLAEFRVPVSVKDGTPFSVQVDDGWIAAMKITGCNDHFCHVSFDVAQNPQMIDQFRQHKMARAAYVLDGSIIMMPVDLAGFSDAIKKVQGAG